MSLCDRCNRRAVPDGDGERIICRWYHILSEAAEDLRQGLIAEGESPVYKYSDPEITDCVGFDGETAKVLSLVKS